MQRQYITDWKSEVNQEINVNTDAPQEDQIGFVVKGHNDAELHQDSNLRTPHPPALVLVNSSCDDYDKFRRNTEKELDLGPYSASISESLLVLQSRNYRNIL